MARAMGEEWVGGFPSTRKKRGEKIVKKSFIFPPFFFRSLLFDHKAKRHTHNNNKPESIELVQTRRGPFRRLKNTTFLFFSCPKSTNVTWEFNPHQKKKERKKEVDGVFFFLFSSTPQQQTSFSIVLGQTNNRNKKKVSNKNFVFFNSFRFLF